MCSDCPYFIATGKNDESEPNCSLLSLNSVFFQLGNHQRYPAQRILIPNSSEFLVINGSRFAKKIPTHVCGYVLVGLPEQSG